MRITWILPLLILALLIVPACAEPYPTGIFPDADTFEINDVTFTAYNVTPGNAIGSIVFSLDPDTEVYYVLGYGAGEQVQGEIKYTKVDIWNGADFSVQSTTYVSMGANTSSSTFIDVAGGLVKRFGVTGHAKDGDAGTTGFAAWDTSVFNAYTAQNIAYYPVVDADKKPIYWFTFVSDAPVDVTVSYGEQSYIQSGVQKTGLGIINEWLAFASSIASTVLQVVSDTLYWLRFIFIDNLGMVVTLYIAATMAFAARSCNGNPIKMGKTFIHDQRELFHFILGLWHTLVDLIASFRGIFRI